MFGDQTCHVWTHLELTCCVVTCSRRLHQKLRYKRSLVCVDVAGRDTFLQLSFTSLLKKKKKKKTEVAKTKTNNFCRVKSTFFGDFWKPESFCSSVATMGEEMFLLVGESNNKLAYHVACCVFGSEMNHLPSLT